MMPTIVFTGFNMEMYTYKRSLKVYAYGPKTGEIMRASLDVETDIDEHDTLLVQGKTHKECSLTGINLQDKTIKDVAHPNKDEIMASIGARILNSFHDIDAKRNWAYYGR